MVVLTRTRERQAIHRTISLGTAIGFFVLAILSLPGTTTNDRQDANTFQLLKGSSSSWPAVRFDKLVPNDKGIRTAPLVHLGHSFVGDRTLFRDHLQEFLMIYKQRPEKDNICGIRFNHAFALWLAVRTLKPKMVIESGVNSGISTFFIRKGSSDTHIVSIDPEDKPICGQPVRWLDSVSQERYLGKENFVDFCAIDWNDKLKKRNLTPDEVLVYVDDHLPFFPRVSVFLKYGFRHVILEDNYKLGEGATRGDKWATPKQLFMGGVRPESPQDAQWLLDNLNAYAEFPPLVAATLAGTHHKRKVQGGFLHATEDPTHYEEPILRPEEDSKDKALFQEIMSVLELDHTFKEPDSLSYTQIMNYCFIVYMDFKPFAPTLRNAFSPKSPV